MEARHFVVRRRNLANDGNLSDSENVDDGTASGQCDDGDYDDKNDETVALTATSAPTRASTTTMMAGVGTRKRTRSTAMLSIAVVLFTTCLGIAVVVVVLGESASVYRQIRQRAVFSTTMTHNADVQRYFDRLESFFGGPEHLPTCYATQVGDGGWKKGYQHPRTSITTNNAQPPTSNTRAAMPPTFVFVAGTEGSGHHTLEEIAGVIKSYYDDKMKTTNSSAIDDYSGRDDDTSRIVVDLKPHLMPVIYQQGAPTNPNKEPYAVFFHETIKSRLETYPPLQELKKKAARTKSRAIFFDSQDAYPFGAGDSYRYADITHLQQLHEEGYIDLKVILLSRDPTSATFSNNRRMFHHDAVIEQQARLMENSMTFLSAMTSQLPCDAIMVWPLEFFVSDPKMSLSALAVFLDIDQDVFAGKEGEEIARTVQTKGNKSVKFSPLGAYKRNSTMRLFL
jgi:hypothetical protein